MNKVEREQYTAEKSEQIVAAFHRCAGNISAVAREVELTRKNVRIYLRKAGLDKKPLAGGKLKGGTKETKAPLPAKGRVQRYILTSAQNNTHVHDTFWQNLLALADHYNAEIMVGTFSYNQNHYGKLAVKQGTEKEYQHDLWFDNAVKPYIKDERVTLAPGLVWAGEMNIQPTEENPLSGLETYGHQSSAIFPHTKLAMRSIATTHDLPVKLIYTTGTVTQMNYIQKKAGLKAEHHHRYAFLLAEVDSDGNWWVRQVAARKNGKCIQDLNVLVENGEVTSTKATAEAITWGDLHSTFAEPWVIESSQAMLDSLHPKFQFIHDIMEGASINRHVRKHKAVHAKFHTWLRGLHRLDAELKQTRTVLERYLRPWCQTIVPDSNHDGWWLKSWLNDFDYRVDPGNAVLFLKLQAFMYAEIQTGKMPKDVNITERAFVTEAGLQPGAIKFLLPDESFTICEDVECGMHGHLGPNGAQGTPLNLSKIGKKATTAHTHSAGIYNGLYVAGTSSKLRWDYTYGPSSWTHAHVVCYPNGQRAIITLKNGKWRA